MVKRSILFTLVILAVSLFCIHDAWNNNAQPPAGYTGAPGETTCANISCHGGTPIAATTQLTVQVQNSPASYQINTNYFLIINLGVSAMKYGFELTAVDNNGNAVGTITLPNAAQQHTTLSTGSNGRQYVGHDAVNTINGWSCRWTAPSAYVGPVTFYCSALAANGDGTVNGDQTYTKTLVLPAFGAASGAVPNFTINPNPACINDTVVFTNTSTGAITSYSWNFGSGATPATATTAGPHRVSYAGTGTKTITLTVTDTSGQITQKTSTLTVGVPPTATINVTTATICKGDTTTLTASGGAHYRWNTGDTTATIAVHPTATTPYSVTVSNSPNCFGTASSTITVRTGPTANAGPDRNVCVGDTVSITATGGVRYLWITGDTTATIRSVVPIAGVFPLTVKVTDANGCSAFDTVIITSANKPVVNIPDQSVCGVSTVTLDAGNPGSRYRWSNNDTTKTITVTAAGHYTVTVTNASGCTASGGANVTITASLPGNLHDTTVCQGQALVLDAGYPSATYAWSTSATTRTITVTTPGTYSVTVTNSGCTGSDTAVVQFTPAPIANAGSDISICAGDSGLIGTAPVNGVTYSWAPTAGITSPAASRSYVKPTITTNYVLTASAGSCSAKDTVNVTVNPVPTVTFSGLATGYCVDNNTPHALTGSPVGGTFSGPGITGSSFNAATAGIGSHIITYTYTNGNNCTATTTQTVRVNALPQPVIYGVPVNACVNDTPIQLTLSPVGGTLSGTGISGTTFDPALAGGGTFTLQYVYTDSIGCSGNISATISVIAVPVSFSGISGAYCSNDNTNYPLTGTPIHGTFSGPGVIGTQFNPQAAGSGTKNVVYSYDTLGCTFTNTHTVSVNGLQISSRDTFVCLGASITLTATGGTSYLWSNGETTATITVTPNDTTIYTVSGQAPGCGPTTDTVTVDVIPALPVNFSGLAASFCSNDTAVQLVGSPAGGVFFGDGLNGSVFDPTTAPIGGPYPIKYTYTNTFGCVDSVKQYVSVVLAPTATIPPLDSSYCLNALPVALSGIPSVGIFTGDGISNNTFIPYFAGLGTHVIKYKAPQATGCAASTAVIVTVHAPPTVAVDTLAAVYCTNSDTVVLHGTPIGGLFSGPGVTQNVFSPANLPAGGPIIVRYTSVDSFGCSASAITITEISSLPPLQLVGVPVAYCTNQAPVALNGLPANGTFSGTAVSNNQFHPDSAGAGNHTIVFSYTNGIGCRDSLLTTVTVRQSPTANINNLDTSYCLNAPSIRLDATPQGGNFSGVGITGNLFDPTTAGTGGPYNINYTYTDGFGCSDTFTQQVSIKRLANVSIAGLNPDYCYTENYGMPATTVPSGGVLTGAGIVDTLFFPSRAGIGPHTLAYTYTTTDGCTSYATRSVNVNNCVTGINAIDDLQAVTVYPNPTDGILNIEMTGYENTDATINVYNLQGMLVHNSKANNILSGGVKTIGLKGMAQGIYLLRIETSTSAKVVKVVIQ